MPPDVSCPPEPTETLQARERLQQIARDPWRPPDWRWRLLTIEPGAADLLDDRALRAAARWRARGCAESAGYHLAAARQLSLASPDDIRRAETEARLLAHQTPRLIGFRSTVSCRAAKVYRALWFDTKSRLADRAFIHQWIVQINRLREGRRLPIAWLLRAAGYVGGTRILEELIHAERQLTAAERAQGVAGFLAPRALTPRVLQAWIAECVPDQPDGREPILRGPLYEHFCAKRRPIDSSLGHQPGDCGPQPPIQNQSVLFEPEGTRQ